MPAPLIVVIVTRLFSMVCILYYFSMPWPSHSAKLLPLHNGMEVNIGFYLRSFRLSK